MIIEYEKLIRVKMACDLFLRDDYYIKEVAEIMGMSKSTIQRYLRDSLVKCLYNRDEQQAIDYKLKENIKKGKIKGGNNYAKNNQYVKRKDGKFNGSITK